MGLFKLFVPKADPIVAWRPEFGLVTDFDFNFDTHMLCGIKPGDPAALLWKLGPSDDPRKEADGCFNYFSKGVRIDVENGLVVSFVLFFNDKLQQQFLAFKSPSGYRGQAISPQMGMTETEIKTIFGEPYWRDEDKDEIILFYEFGNIEWQIELDRREGLTAIVVLTPPVLGDEAQRKVYSVNKPWPPIS